MYSQIYKNKIRTGVLMILFLALFTLVFFAVSNLVDKSYASVVIIFGGLFALISTIAAYYYSDRIVLRMANAHPADPSADKYILDVVEGLATANRFPVPRVYIIETDVPNAFATGRNPENSVIAVTRGIITLLNREELEGVLAHEMSHIANYDILYASIVAVLAGSIVMIAYSMRWFAFGGSRRSRKSSDSSGGSNAIIILVSLLFIIIAPIFAKLVQLAISRKREYLADASGAKMIGYPLGLASALEKLKNTNDPKIDKRIKGLDNEAIAGLFIVNPLKSSSVQGLFSTHPPIDKRIEILRKM
jgi:heat shock protein HtpX